MARDIAETHLILVTAQVIVKRDARVAGAGALSRGRFGFQIGRAFRQADKS